MNTEKAAKLLIYAWIKDWPLRTLYDAITEKSSKNFSDEEIKKFSNKYSFMPSDHKLYIFNKGRGVSVKKFMFDNYKKINDILWDTEDNLKKLEYWVYFKNKKCESVMPSSKYNTKERNEKRVTSKNYVGYVQSKMHYREIFDKSSGHHWFTVK